MPFDITKLQKDFAVKGENSKSDTTSTSEDDFTKHIKELLAKSHVEGSNSSPTGFGIIPEDSTNKVPEATISEVPKNTISEVPEVSNDTIVGPGMPIINKEKTLNAVGPGNVSGERKKYQENEIDYSKELNKIDSLQKAVDELPDIDNGKYNASVNTRASAVNTMNFTPNTSTAFVAKYYLKKAKESYEKPQDTEKSFIQNVKDMGKSFVNGIGDWDYFTLGMYGAGASQGLTRLYDKMKNNPTGKPIDELLSKQEQLALNAYFINVQASQDRMDNVSVASAAGDIAGRSLPYMLEFMATGGLEGATEGAQKAFMTYVAKNSPKILLNSKVGKGVIKFGTGLANKSLVTFARSGGMPSTYTNITQALSARNPDGTQVSLGKGLYTGLVDVYTNNISELYGEEIMKSVGLLAKGLDKGTKAILPNKIKAAFSSNLSKKISGVMGIANKGNIFKLVSGIKPLQEISKLSGFHGLPGEILEEYWGSALQSVLTADPSQFTDMFTVKNNMQLVTGFLPMQVFSLFTGVPTIARYSKAKKDVAKAQTTLTSFLIANDMDTEQAESFVNSLVIWIMTVS